VGMVQGPCPRFAFLQIAEADFPCRSVGWSKILLDGKPVGVRPGIPAFQESLPLQYKPLLAQAVRQSNRLEPGVFVRMHFIVDQTQPDAIVQEALCYMAPRKNDRIVSNVSVSEQVVDRSRAEPRLKVENPAGLQDVLSLPGMDDPIPAHENKQALQIIASVEKSQCHALHLQLVNNS
jgi:hypothetical protein